MVQKSLNQYGVNASKCPADQSKQETTDLACKGLVL